jgi:gamma-glutamyltranspeptidase / glutathione hydrolase
MALSYEALCALPARAGPKPVTTGKRAACSADNAIVVHAALRVLEAGGNAVDAGVAACLVQAAIEPHMTNHAGTVTALYWEASSRRLAQLNSIGTFPPELAPFHPVGGQGGYAAPGTPGPAACIPGFMPGLGELHRRYGTRPWRSLCEEAIYWAREGHPVTCFERGIFELFASLFTYFPEGRALFMPNGHFPAVGSRFANPALARTLEGLAIDGPEHFTEGRWARDFVRTANALGWQITLEDMRANPPRWQEPLRWQHRGYEIAQLAPPERQGVYCAFVLGVLEALGSSEYPADSSDAIYNMAHALRWAELQSGFINDPLIFEVPTDVLLDPSYHGHIASIIRGTRPRRSLREHVRLTTSLGALVAAGVRIGASPPARQPAGSCELAIVDEAGNWLQMMNTLQGGGIPGAVVNGVPMVGSHASFGNMAGLFDAWLVAGSRQRSVIGNTMILRDGAPWLSLGTPGNVFYTVAQVLSSLLDHHMEPYEAVCAPRMLPLGLDYSLYMEQRLQDGAAQQLTDAGIRLNAAPEYDFNMGSFQLCWRDPHTGMLSACADPRRSGIADGIDA